MLYSISLHCDTKSTGLSNDEPKKTLENAQYIVLYGGFIHDNPIKNLMAVQLTFLTSPEYTLPEGIRTIQNKGMEFTMDAMWKEIMNINFMEEKKKYQELLINLVLKESLFT